VASPARKPLEAVSERRPTGLPDWLHDFTAFPRDFFKRAAPRLTHGALLCFCIVQEETIGKPRARGTPPPEISEPITETEFAQWTGLTVWGIRKALHELDDLGLIRRRKRGREYCYAVEPTRLFTLPQRARRSLDRTAKPATVEPIPIRLTCPLGAECPVSEVYDAPDGLTNSTRDAGEQKAKDTGTPVPVSFAAPSPSPNGDLRSMLERTLSAKLHSVPDQAVLLLIAKCLGDAPIGELEAAIELKRDKVRSWPFVPLLAKDCRVAWERLGRPASYDALLDELVDATGDAALAVARKILAHPACAAQQRTQLLRMFPGLHWEAHNPEVPHAHPP